MKKLTTVVFPEGSDPRVQEAAKKLADRGRCQPILVGTNLPTITGVETLDPVTVDLTGYTLNKIHKHTDDESLIAGAAYVAQGHADAIVGGAEATTGAVAMVYKYTIGMAPKVDRFASVFRMVRDGERYIFADCAINIDPDAETLSEIAHMAHMAALEFGLEPRVGFLSCATGNSAAGPSVTKVSEAVKITRVRFPDMICDGPLQFDAAFVPDIAERKCPDSQVAGKVNVFVFPCLDAGNIGYKMAERLGGFQAIGPILTGLAKPAHDLSRGSSTEDIIAVTEVAINQCD